MNERKYNIQRLEPNLYKVSRDYDPSFTAMVDVSRNSVYDIELEPGSTYSSEWVEERVRDRMSSHLSSKLSKADTNKPDKDGLTDKEIAFLMSSQEFWGDISNAAFVAKAKEFVWQMMSLKMKASAVFQANRAEIMAERNLKNPNRRIRDKNRPEYTKQVTGIAMSFIFEEQD